MKRTGILHGELSQIVASMGHGDKLVIADNGLPVPEGVKVIDLAIRPGMVPFLDVLKTVCEELVVESYVIAEELQDDTRKRAIAELVGDIRNTSVYHEEFKIQTKDASVIVRTGEWTPYSNVILVAGVPF